MDVNTCKVIPSIEWSTTQTHEHMRDVAPTRQPHYNAMWDSQEGQNPHLMQ